MAFDRRSLRSCLCDRVGGVRRESRLDQNNPHTSGKRSCDRNRISHRGKAFQSRRRDAGRRAVGFCGPRQHFTFHSFQTKSIHKSMTKNVIALLIVSLTTIALAAPIKFDFKDPKGVNNVVFKTDAPLESINGTASGISGTVTFDPENPAATKGKIVVATKSLHVGNATMKEHMQGDNWMQVEKFPDLTFELGALKDVKSEGNVTTANATGKMTVKGVTKEMTIPVKLTYLKD